MKQLNLTWQDNEMRISLGIGELALEPSQNCCSLARCRWQCLCTARQRNNAAAFSRQS